MTSWEERYFRDIRPVVETHLSGRAELKSSEIAEYLDDYTPQEVGRALKYLVQDEDVEEVEFLDSNPMVWRIRAEDVDRVGPVTGQRDGGPGYMDRAHRLLLEKGEVEHRELFDFFDKHVAGAEEVHQSIMRVNYAIDEFVSSYGVERNEFGEYYVTE